MDRRTLLVQTVLNVFYLFPQNSDSHVEIGQIPGLLLIEIDHSLPNYTIGRGLIKRQRQSSVAVARAII